MLEGVLPILGNRERRLRARLGSGLAAALLLGTPAAHAGAHRPSPQTPPAAIPQQDTVGAASLAGTVIAANGALISGATITLSAGTQDAGQGTRSDDNGRFSLTGIPAGSYTLAVTLPGFTTARQQVTLRPRQALQLAPIYLALATVSLTVNAITPEQMGVEQLHAEEQQRLAGVLPNFFVSYNWTAPPLTVRQKFTLATKNASDPGNFVLAGAVSGIQQAANAFPGYGQGAAGFGRRYGANLGNLVIGSYMGGAVLPSLFHQDPRYFYKGTGTKRSRFVYAATRALVTRGDNGHTQPNVAGVLGDLSAAAISNAYYPASDRQGAGLFLTNGLLSLAGDAMSGVVQEFFLHRVTSKGKPPTSTP